MDPIPVVATRRSPPQSSHQDRVVEVPPAARWNLDDADMSMAFVVCRRQSWAGRAGAPRGANVAAFAPAMPG
jgi:hypothetical protein